MADILIMFAVSFTAFLGTFVLIARTEVRDHGVWRATGILALLALSAVIAFVSIIMATMKLIGVI